MNIKINKAKPEDWEILQKLNNEVYLNDSEFDGDLDLDRPFSDGGSGYLKKLASGEYGNPTSKY